MRPKERAIQFLNKAKEYTDLVRHFYDEKGELVSYIIGASNAQHILEIRKKTGKAFTNLSFLLDLNKFGEKKLDLFIESFEDEYLNREMLWLKDLEAQSNQTTSLEEAQKQLDEKVQLVLKRMFSQANTAMMDADVLYLRMSNSEVLKLVTNKINRHAIANPFKYIQQPNGLTRINLDCIFYNQSLQFQTAVNVHLSV